MTLDPAAIERFRRDLEALTGEPPSPDRKLGLAVSGGPDSLALLLLAHAAYSGAVIAATVDHGLRPESADEAAFVHELCAALGVPHAVLTGAMPAGNLQDAARALRYALLTEWAADRARWVATAHQQDDIAETFLMRGRRGAGLGGLAAMRAARPLGGVLLVRPLLGWARAELEAIVAESGIDPVRDPSNTDPRFDRARIRTLLAASSDLPANRLALAARNLRDAEDALAWVTAGEWQARAVVEGEAVRLDPAGLPRELRRRLAGLAVATVRAGQDQGLAWRESGLDGLLATLDAGGTGTIADVLARSRKGIWTFEPAPPRRSH